MGGTETMIERARALPGRSEPMRVPDQHFVLGSPMKAPWPAGFKVAVFANGCFWGSEKGIWRLPGGGIHTTAVGYAAGYTPNPSYEEVCSGLTGHTEAVQVVYDPSKISFADLLRWFWEAHDPTSGMGQGNDRGTQYRSGFYWTDDDQRALIQASAMAYEAALAKAGKARKITTEMRAASDFETLFYYGEDYHRARVPPRLCCAVRAPAYRARAPGRSRACATEQYLAKPGARPYCSAQPQVVSLPQFEEWAPAALKEAHAPRLPEAFWARHGPTPHCVIRSPHAPIAWDDWEAEVTIGGVTVSVASRPAVTLSGLVARPELNGRRGHVVRARASPREHAHARARALAQARTRSRSLACMHGLAHARARVHAQARTRSRSRTQGEGTCDGYARASSRRHRRDRRCRRRPAGGWVSGWRARRSRLRSSPTTSRSPRAARRTCTRPSRRLRHAS